MATHDELRRALEHQQLHVDDDLNGIWKLCDLAKQVAVDTSTSREELLVFLRAISLERYWYQHHWTDLSLMPLEKNRGEFLGWTMTHARARALRGSWLVVRSCELYRKVEASKYEFLPGLAEEAAKLLKFEGFDEWLAEYELREAAFAENEFLDAQRCLRVYEPFLATFPPGTDPAPGALLTTWRSMTDEQKREAVRSYWDSAAHRLRNSFLREGAKWPSTTFEIPAWAYTDEK